MKRNVAGILFACCLFLLFSTDVSAVNHVEVVPQSFSQGQAGATVTVFITNDISIRSLVIPLVFRQVQGGAFITSLQVGFGDRLPTGTGNPLAEIQVTNQYAVEDGVCKSGAPGGFGTISFTDPNPHAVTGAPMALLASRTKIFGPPLSPGADVTGSVVLTVDINTSQGLFEIDTTCMNPANHLMFVEDPTNTPYPPTFTKAFFSVGNAPVARDTSWSVNEDDVQTVTYLPASDADGDPVTFTLTGGPVHGAVSGFDPNTGAFTYTPVPNYNGPDSLTFEATDGNFVSNTGVVWITVVSVNDPPIARDTAIVTDEDTPVNARYQGEDFDSPSLTFIRASGPFRGSITAFNASTGEFTYLPNLDYSGADSITFVINDGDDNSNPALVRITINPINDPPVARDTVVSTPVETPVVAQFQAYDVDDGPPTFTHLTGPFNGTFSGFDPATGVFTYEPDSGYVGPDSITFIASDALADSDPGTVRITVTPSNCVCACWSDPDCDEAITATDLGNLVDVVFFNSLATVSLHCPTWDVDYNCDCALDVIDLAKLIDIIFFSDTNFCDPCTANCFPMLLN